MRIRDLTVCFRRYRTAPQQYQIVVAPDPFTGVGVIARTPEELLAQHPEDLPRDAPGGMGAEIAEYMRRLAPMFAPLGRLELVPAGTRWHNGCVEFDTTDHRTVVLPLDHVLSLELTDVREVPG